MDDKLLYIPNNNKTNVAIREIMTSSQFNTVVPSRAARALWITPIIGFRARIQEYLPTIPAG